MPGAVLSEDVEGSGNAAVADAGVLILLLSRCAAHFFRP
jgi:hypothetical protein